MGDRGAATAIKSDGRKVGTGKRRGQQPPKRAGPAHGSHNSSYSDSEESTATRMRRCDVRISEEEGFVRLWARPVMVAVRTPLSAAERGFTAECITLQVFSLFG